MELDILSFVFVLLAIQVFCLIVFVVIVRWVFRIDEILERLESIDESLRQMPAARLHWDEKEGERRSA